MIFQNSCEVVLSGLDGPRSRITWDKCVGLLGRTSDCQAGPHECLSLAQ